MSGRSTLQKALRLYLCPLDRPPLLSFCPHRQCPMVVAHEYSNGHKQKEHTGKTSREKSPVRLFTQPWAQINRILWCFDLGENKKKRDQVLMRYHFHKLYEGVRGEEEKILKSLASHSKQQWRGKAGQGARPCTAWTNACMHGMNEESKTPTTIPVFTARILNVQCIRHKKKLTSSSFSLSSSSSSWRGLRCLSS